MMLVSVFISRLHSVAACGDDGGGEGKRAALAERVVKGQAADPREHALEDAGLELQARYLECQRVAKRGARWDNVCKRAPVDDADASVVLRHKELVRRALQALDRRAAVARRNGHTPRAAEIRDGLCVGKKEEALVGVANSRKVHVFQKPRSLHLELIRAGDAVSKPHHAALVAEVRQDGPRALLVLVVALGRFGSVDVVARARAQLTANVLAAGQDARNKIHNGALGR